MKFITRQAYLMMAILGGNFCNSAKKVREHQSSGHSMRASSRVVKTMLAMGTPALQLQPPEATRPSFVLEYL
jgi:hypothetical protein